MKLLVVFAALFAVVLAVPDEHDTKILRQDSEVLPKNYHYDVETSDGTKKEEAGELKDVGSEHEHIVAHGSYSWVDEKTGEHFELKYTADENGFQPEGAHLPKA